MIIPFSYPINVSILTVLNIVGICLAFRVYWSNRSISVNKGFFLTVIAILAWIDFYYLAQGDNSVFWYRLSASFVFLMFIVYYFFTVRWFLGKYGWYEKFGYFVLIYSFIFAVLSITTNLIIADSEVIGSSLTKPILNPVGWWILYVFAAVVTIIINWALIKEYLVYPKENKLKFQYFIVGIVIFGGLNIIFNVILPAFFNDYRFYELGNYSVIFFLIFTAYAIVKHNLFDIKIFLSQTLVFIILVFVVARVVLSSNTQELLVNISLAILVFITGILLLSSISKEKKLTIKLLEETKKSLELEKKLREKITKKTGEMIKKMEDIVKE